MHASCGKNRSFDTLQANRIQRPFRQSRILHPRTSASGSHFAGHLHWGTLIALFALLFWYGCAPDSDQPPNNNANKSVFNLRPHPGAEVVDVRVAAKFKSILCLRVDITDMSAVRKALPGRYGGYAIPFLFMLDRQGQVSQTFTGLMTDTTLAAAINKAGGTS